MGVVVVLLLLAGGVFLLVRATRRQKKVEAPASASPPRSRLEVTISSSGGSSTTVLGMDGPADTAPVDARHRLMRALSEISGEFFADVGASANGVFLVGARDGPGFPPDREDGLLVLVNRRTGEVMFRTRMPRPHSPSVSDDGRVVVENWGSRDELEGSLVCFERDGRQAWSLDLRANVHPSGISPSGRRAFVSTARSDYKAHSNRIFVVDARTGELLWDHDNWRLTLTPYFEGDALFVSITMPDESTRSFKFEEHGMLGSDFEKERDEIEITLGGVGVLASKVQDALAASPPMVDAAERFMTLLDAERLWDDASRARYLRVQGEVFEARGDLAAAVAAYRAALELNPKVGVKRRLAALEKELA